MYSSDEFYTKFAPFYENYSHAKKDYISCVNNFIIHESKPHLKVVDIGGGNGKRSQLISHSIHASSLTIIDNSKGMADLTHSIKDLQMVFADISDSKFQSDDTFGIAICLWNVLGHIPTQEKRKIALMNMANLIEDNGFLFIDVNNRYNISNYGLKAVLKNIYDDIFDTDGNKGNFELHVDIGNEKIQTRVHIFNPFEMNDLIKSSGLKIIKKQFINYKTGKKSKTMFGGQLVYKLIKK